MSLMKWKCSDAEINWEIALTLQFNNQNVNVGKNDSHLKKYGNTSAGDSEGFHFGFEPKKKFEKPPCTKTEEVWCNDIFSNLKMRLFTSVLLVSCQCLYSECKEAIVLRCIFLLNCILSGGQYSDDIIMSGFRE